MYIGYVRKFIDFIDNVNATSTIGTLEFMDKMAKYNQDNTLCKLPSNADPLKYNMVDLHNTVRMQNEADKQEKYESGVN